MVRLLVGSIGAIALVFLLVNFAYLKGLGLSAIANIEAVTANLIRQTLDKVVLFPHPTPESLQNLVLFNIFARQPF